MNAKLLVLFRIALSLHRASGCAQRRNLLQSCIDVDGAVVEGGKELGLLRAAA